jgi:rsbT antagonist protein RsbS
MARVPIIRIRDVLIASVQEELGDDDVIDLQERLNDIIEHGDIRGVLLDVSALETIDSFIGRSLSDTAAGARLLGAETVVVGIRPAVAITLVELGLQLPRVNTALDVDRGLELLARLVAASERVIPVAEEETMEEREF